MVGKKGEITKVFRVQNRSSSRIAVGRPERNTEETATLGDSLSSPRDLWDFGCLPTPSQSKSGERGQDRQRGRASSVVRSNLDSSVDQNGKHL